MKTSYPDRAQRLRVRNECTASHLRRASRAISRIHDQALEPSGLSGAQFSLLVALSLFGEAPLQRVAEELGLDRTTLTRNLQPLERDGLVRLLRLTDAGQRALQRAYPLWEKAQSAVVKALGQQRWTTLLDGLEATSRLREKE